MKQTKEKAEEMGIIAFRSGLGRAPCQNKEFLEWMPNGNIDDNALHKTRMDLMRAYVIGWTSEDLKILAEFLK